MSETLDAKAACFDAVFVIIVAYTNVYSVKAVEV